QYLMGRFLALAGLLTAYVVVMSAALLLTARVVAGPRPGDAAGGVGLMILQMLILLAVSLLGSTVLPILANGVVMLVLFGLAWLGGIIGFVGTIPPGNELMANLGTAVSLLLPADAVWRGASYHILPPSFLVASSLAGGDQEIGLPFGPTPPGSPPPPPSGAPPPPTSSRPASWSPARSPAATRRSACRSAPPPPSPRPCSPGPWPTRWPAWRWPWPRSAAATCDDGPPGRRIGRWRRRARRGGGGGAGAHGGGW